MTVLKYRVCGLSPAQ